jgi:hypothetical protein
MRRVAEELGVPCVLLDIDTDDVETADELVKKYGDWTTDYLIPQIFVEADDGKIKHVLTGDPRGVQYTRSAVETLVKTLLNKPKIPG